jgi:anti-sigma factor RsiW
VPRVSDREIADAVAAEEGWMEALLGELVAAPTVLGDEEVGQQVMREAFRDTASSPATWRSTPAGCAQARSTRRSPVT